MKIKKIIAAALVGVMVMVSVTGCFGEKGASDKVVFYSNADDEAVAAMEAALKDGGYDGKYVFQSLGTSELSGKLLAEGNKIEADFITMSSYYVEDAQKKEKMFKDLDFKVDTIKEYPSYAAPTTSQEGSIFINTEVMKAKNLDVPKSIKDLANPKYKGLISVADISTSSTAWLLIQAIVSEYGDGEEGKAILKNIYKNAGDHIESSGSAPLKKVRAGEVAIGFGLRQQAVADSKDGLPIKSIDPIEGNFSLEEVIGVIDKGDETNPLAMEMAKCIVSKARPQLMKSYPMPLYKGEKLDEANKPKYIKEFNEALTVKLLEKHIKFSDECKKAATK
ncbi:MAG: ABC transporter substrate-binding protein [Anaerovoracaceae bacterium]